MFKLKYLFSARLNTNNINSIEILLYRLKLIILKPEGELFSYTNSKDYTNEYYV